MTGGLRENATDPFRRILPANFTRDEMRQGVKLISQMMTRTGVTSVTDAQASAADLLGYEDAREAGELSLRVYCLMHYGCLDKMTAAGVRAGLGDEWLRVGGIKLVCDGSISERTARLTEPYVGRPNDFGILVSSEEELYTRARKAHEAGWQIPARTPMAMRRSTSCCASTSVCSGRCRAAIRATAWNIARW